jgi:hypothetical protein
MASQREKMKTSPLNGKIRDLPRRMAIPRGKMMTVPVNRKRCGLLTRTVTYR